MFLRAAYHKSWENTHTVQQLSIHNDPNLAHREQMEDAYFYEEGSNGEFVFGILDGHNGRSVVELVTKNLPGLILSKLTILNDVSEILKESFQQMEDIVSNELRSKADQIGSTCTVCLVRIENGQKVVYTANIGDTSAFLFSYGMMEELTVIHRANNQEEKLRVKACGSYVSMNRIEGQLEVFRAFGDLSLKKKGLIAEPSISRVVLSASSANPLYNIVIACDGLWDFVKPTEVEKVVNRTFNNCGKMASELKNLAKTSRSNDNITVMTIQIDASIPSIEITV